MSCNRYDNNVQRTVQKYVDGVFISAGMQRSAEVHDMMLQKESRDCANNLIKGLSRSFEELANRNDGMKVAVVVHWAMIGLVRHGLAHGDEAIMSSKLAREVLRELERYQKDQIRDRAKELRAALSGIEVEAGDDDDSLYEDSSQESPGL